MNIYTPTRTIVIATAATVVTTGFVGIVGASTASADQAIDASAHGLGSQATLVNGDVVQGWTVTDLKPSTDAIPYPVEGTLWEATATDEAIKGSVIPIVSDLDARTPSGQTYRALYQVATLQGVNPATLAQGQKTTGKVYFDVTGDKPNGVVYNAGGQDLATWVQSQPPQRRSGGAATAAPTSGPATTPTPAAAPAPAGSQQISAGSPATSPTPAAAPAPAGSQQTSAGSTATPAPAASQGTPIPGSQGTPMPANSPTPAPAANQPTPAPLGGQVPPAGSPPMPTPAVPAPAGSPPMPTPPAPAPVGSQGFAGSPTTP